MLTWIEIDGTAIGRNLDAFRSVVTPGTAVMAVVKANAYGHGLEIITSAAEASREVDYFGVATEEEGVALRTRLRHPGRR